MRHLASRFVPKCAENFVFTSNQYKFNISPIHVVDPTLDFREQFKNIDRLSDSLSKRRMFDHLKRLPMIQDDYFCWWKAYTNYANCDIDKDDVDKRNLYYNVRNELVKHSEGILNALALPNTLDNKYNMLINSSLKQDLKIEDDLDEICQHLRCNHKFNWSSNFLLRDIRSLLNFFKKSLKPSPVPFSGPFLVRPALVECCNIDLNEFPLITDGIDSPFCLVGVNIPSFLSILVNGKLSSLNNWPISFLTSGPVYCRSLTDSKQFDQSEHISILTMGRDEDECSKRQIEIYLIVSTFLKKFLSEENIIEFETKPEYLQLWERSSFNIGKRVQNCDEIVKIASFSNIGDYISRRAHIIFDHGKNSKSNVKNEDGKHDKNKNQNYVQMEFATINLDSLINESI